MSLKTKTIKTPVEFELMIVVILPSKKDLIGGEEREGTGIGM